jgi:glycosyltransferase involved in cell wall biosynthesis
MRRVRVLQIIDSLETGGAEVLAVNIANLLAENGAVSFLCSTRKEGPLKINIHENVNYLFLNRKKRIDLKAIFELRRFVKLHNIELIHAHATSYFIAFLVKLFYWKVRIIWHDHFGKSQDLQTRKLFPLQLISLTFESIIAVNTALKLWSEKNLYCKQNYFLNNFAFFNSQHKTTILKGIDNKRIIHLAGFRAQKDHITLIKAFTIFYSNNNKEWSLHLVGAINKGAYSKSVVNLIKKNKLESCVFTYGNCLDIEHILKQGSIGVLSSKSEGLPLSLLEYGLAKLPVIVTDVGECSSVVKKNESGYIIAPENSNDFAIKLDILANSINKRITFGNRNFEIVNKQYSKDIFVAKLIKIYNH